MYEPLLWLHPSTLEFIPALATHWQISPDRLTYRFRINPNARWSDGQPVVAEDVVATWDLHHGHRSAGPDGAARLRQIRKAGRREQIHRPREEQTAQLAKFSLFRDAGRVGDFPGTRPQEDQRRSLPDGIQLQAPAWELALTRWPSRMSPRARGSLSGGGADYWAAKERRNVGRGNFDELRFIVVRDENLSFEMFKKGDYDFHSENISQTLGPGDELRSRPARVDSEAKGLQRQSERHSGTRVQHAEGALRRHPSPAGDGALAESGAADRDAVLQRIPSAELVLRRWHL